MIKAEERSYVSSYQTQTTEKIVEVANHQKRLLKSLRSLS